MNKLMSANLVRMVKDKSFAFCAAAIFVFGLFFSCKMTTEKEFDTLFCLFSLIIGFASAIFSSMFLGTEYSDGTMRNKLMVGHKRSSIYFSSLFTCFIASLILILAYMIPVFAIGIPRLGWFQMNTKGVLILILMLLLMTLGFTTLFTMIAMLVTSKAASAVACIIIMLFLLVIGTVLKARLEETPFYDAYAYTGPDGMVEEPETPNPNYLSGAKREVYQCGLELLPQGQALIISFGDMINPLRMILFSTGVSIVLTSVGVILYRKKDIR